MLHVLVLTGLCLLGVGLLITSQRKRYRIKHTGMLVMAKVTQVQSWRDSGSPSLRGKVSKKRGGREQRICPSLDLVRNQSSHGGRPLPKQHTTEAAINHEAILVPLDLAEFHIVNQEWLANGTIRVVVMATATQAACPHCHKQCVKIHDTRPRKKRDCALREHRVELIVLKRRFRCVLCRKAGTRTRYGVWLAKKDDRAFARRDRPTSLHAADLACRHCLWSRSPLCAGVFPKRGTARPRGKRTDAG